MNSQAYGFALIAILSAMLISATRGAILLSNQSLHDSSPPRKLPGGETINYVTNSYPYYTANMGNSNYDGVQLPLSKPDEAKVQSLIADHQGRTVGSPPRSLPYKYVYYQMHFPGYSNNPFNYFDMARAWNPYYGLKPPFNLHHPSNYFLGFQPYANPGYAPTFPYLLQDPFKTGIYGGYGYGLYGIQSPFMINPLPQLPHDPQQELIALQAELKKLNAQLQSIKNANPSKAGNAESGIAANQLQADNQQGSASSNQEAPQIGLQANAGNNRSPAASSQAPMINGLDGQQNFDLGRQEFINQQNLISSEEYVTDQSQIGNPEYQKEDMERIEDVHGFPKYNDEGNMDSASVTFGFSSSLDSSDSDVVHSTGGEWVGEKSVDTDLNQSDGGSDGGGDRKI